MIHRGTEPFQLDMEYVLYVKAEDQNGRMGRRFQSTPEERLSIVGGKRPPQFYSGRVDVVALPTAVGHTPVEASLDVG